MYAVGTPHPRVALGDASTGADPASDPQVIPAGSWCTVGFYQNLLGGLNSFVESWTDLANAWASYVGWPTQTLLVRDTTAYQDAVLQFQVTNDTTVAQVYAVLNALSPDVSIRSIWVNGASPASAATLNAQQAGNADVVSNVLANPVAALASLPAAIGSSLFGGFVPLAIIGGIVLYGVTSAEKTRTYKKYVA